MRVVAILETMWDWRQQTSSAGYAQAPRFFRINKQNFSGRRLYKIVGPQAQLLVTNACRELVSGPEKHGNGNPTWLAENLPVYLTAKRPLAVIHEREEYKNPFQPIDLLMVCGKVAQKTYRDCGFKPLWARVIEMPHPAARSWTKFEIGRHQLLCQ